MATTTAPVILDSTGQSIAAQLGAIAAAVSGGSSKADKADLASIQASGSTNATGSTIPTGTYFYLNGVLVQAKTDIASGAAFTENTNYAAVTAGALNMLSPMGVYRLVLALTQNEYSTFTFSKNTPFLIIINRYATGASGPTYSGLYYGVAGSGSTMSFVTPIVSTSYAEVSVSGYTLSIKPSATYMYAYIVSLNSSAI